jgi:hypothetical protein
MTPLLLHCVVLLESPLQLKVVWNLPLSPLLTRTLNCGEFNDSQDKDREFSGVNSGIDGGEDTQQLAISEASIGTKVFCDVETIVLKELPTQGHLNYL